MVWAKSAPRHQHHDEIRSLTVGRGRDVEMVHVGANVGDNGCDFGAAIGPPAIINEDADRLVELADAFDPLVELQFGVERGLEEAFTDLVVAETRPFGRAPSADVDILSRHSAADQRADSDGCQGESDDRYTHSAMHGRCRTFAWECSQSSWSQQRI